jgi:mono/diheme cytochrome c family protein
VTRLGRAVLLVLLLTAGAARAGDRPALDKSVIRGAIVFRTYCVLCHGANADGQGRAARLYSPRPANLLASRASPDYLRRIIHDGGAALGRSPYMPPWGKELVDDQIADLVDYLMAIRQPGTAGR